MINALLPFGFSTQEYLENKYNENVPLISNIKMFCGTVLITLNSEKLVSIFEQSEALMKHYVEAGYDEVDLADKQV